ncbi:MAG: T9SS type A sorting domain-containing protein [Bacteroidetes bacterium]|nr:T9SS type A sorting domain-containing protein [Bacteroidota bacterium]
MVSLNNNFAQDPDGKLYTGRDINYYQMVNSDNFNRDNGNNPDYNNSNSVDFSCPISWQAKITATDAANIKDSVVIGMSHNGTYGIDTCLGEYLIPPAPPQGIFDFRIIIQPSYNLDAVRSDFRKDTALNVKYWLNFQGSVEGPITFRWEPSSFPSNAQIFLRDDILGTNINMKTRNTFVLNNSGVRYLRIDYEYFTTAPVAVSEDWNIVSVPLLASDMSVSSLFESDAANAYAYSNGYTIVDSLANSIGYWIKFPAAKNYNIAGVLQQNKEINVVSEWNMIGPFEENIPVNKIVSDPDGLLISPFFAYQNGYYSDDTLRPGKGYWVKANGNGKFRKDTAAMFRPSGELYSDQDKNDMMEIEISDHKGNVSRLYLTDADKIHLNYELPPVPPAGIFDSRFESGKYVEALGKNHNIKINSSERPLYIKALNVKNKKIRLSDNFNGEILNVQLKEGEVITISSALDNFLISDESVLPLSYQLSQNFPNPFNPVTVINFQLPLNGTVKLSVFNILGQEVKTLLNDFRQAGNYSIEFNAADLSSGIYYYKLQTGNFSDIKSMILIK